MKKGVWNFILLKNNRGISAIIVTLLMIVLSLVAVGAVWVVISNVLSSGTEQTSSAFGQITLSMKIESVKTDSNGDVLVSVKRNAGAGELSGVNLIVSDGTNSQIIRKDEAISELATKTFTITSAELTDVAFIKDVSVAPITTSNGKETIGNVVNTFEKNKIGLDDLKDYGIVSWWRFEGDAKDEIGDNDGTLEGGATFVDGKFGKAGSFDGSGDWIAIADNPSLGVTAYTVIAWFNPSSNSGWKGIVGKPGRNYNIWYNADSDFIHHRYHDSASTNSGASNTPSNSITKNTWNNVIITNTGTVSKTYINGIEKGAGTVTGSLIIDSGVLTIGSLEGTSINGLIDEVMIFNKALTDKQVKALYELDLSK